MWQVVGQRRVVSLLQRSLETEALAHAYLLVGPRHVGKMTLALITWSTLRMRLVRISCPPIQPATLRLWGLPRHGR